MEVFNGRYYKTCKLFLECTGMWPFQSHFRRLTSHIAWYAIILTLFIPQVLMLIKEWRTPDILFENSASIMFLFSSSAKYSVSYFSVERYRLVCNQIAKDWQKITDRAEQEILKKYNEQIRNLIILYTSIVFGAWATITLMPFIPYVLDKTFPLENATRPVIGAFYGHYIFFEQTDYPYLMCCHASFVFLVTAFLFSGIDTFFVLTVKHTCGLFAIICDRMINVTKFEQYNDSAAGLNSRSVILNNFRKAIVLHNETIRYADLLEDSFSSCFLVVQSLAIVGMAMVAAYVLYYVIDFYNRLRGIVIFYGLMLHMLCLNWVGQQIIESSEQVFNSAYVSDWPSISLKTRKLVSTIMVRSLQPCKLTAGKITILSMASFGMVVRATASYITVFISTM